MLSGIIFVNRNGLRWRDAPKDYGRTRRSTIVGSAGVRWASSRACGLPCWFQGKSVGRGDRVDLLLLHWPEGSGVPRDVQIKELNRARANGMTRHIGISNYNSTEMREAARISEAPLVTNQVEYHPFLSQREVMIAARELGMSLTGYYGMANGRSAKDPVLREISAGHDKTAAQVALRWLVQQPGVIALSKSARIERLRENFSIFDFSLTEGEMEQIFGLAEPDGRPASPSGIAPEWD